MKLFDVEKARNYRHEYPVGFWLSWTFFFAITTLCFVFFIEGLLNNNLPLLLKGSATISMHQQPLGFLTVMIFDMFSLSVMISYLYLLFTKTKP